MLKTHSSSWRQVSSCLRTSACSQAHNELRLQSSLTDESLAHLAPLQRLEELSLKSCAGLQGPGLRHLVGLPNLRRLDLQACIRLTNKGATPPLPLIPAVGW